MNTLHLALVEKRFVKVSFDLLRIRYVQGTRAECSQRETGNSIRSGGYVMSHFIASTTSSEDIRGVWYDQRSLPFFSRNAPPYRARQGGVLTPQSASPRLPDVVYDGDSVALFCGRDVKQGAKV